MWKYLNKENAKEFILSLNLLGDKYSDKDKLKILYTIANNNTSFYTTKFINKRDGSKRKLLVPKPILKNIQKNILRHVLYGLSVSKYAKAYIPKVGLKENALPHINNKIILKLDIKNFFDNITFEMLYRALPNYIFPPGIKVLLLKLCTYDDFLPQGSPTSPALSNLALISFDNYIGDYCQKRGINYTRYCDDLTFSGDFNAQMLKNKVTSYLEELGFNLNYHKTKIIKQNYLQTVTGIVVNKQLNVKKSYRKKIRQEMYYIMKYGLYNHMLKLNKTHDYKLSLQGRINYSLSINPNDKEMQKYQKILQNMI